MSELNSTNNGIQEPPLPHYTASGGPIRPSDRFAFGFWTFGILLALAFGLASYLFAWFVR